MAETNLAENIPSQDKLFCGFTEQNNSSRCTASTKSVSVNLTISDSLCKNIIKTDDN